MSKIVPVDFSNRVGTSYSIPIYVLGYRVAAVVIRVADKTNISTIALSSESSADKTNWTADYDYYKTTFLTNETGIRILSMIDYPQPWIRLKLQAKKKKAALESTFTCTVHVVLHS